MTWCMVGVEREVAYGVIIKESRDMASIPAGLGLGRECWNCDLRPQEEREVSVMVLEWLRRRIMRNVARRRMIRMRTAPPIVPPS